MSNTRLDKSPVFLIVVDAFRSDYLDLGVTPHLSNFVKQGIHVEKLTPSFGYCEITEYFTGAKPEVTGKLAQFNFDPKKSPYYLLSPMAKFLSLFTRSNKSLDHLIHLLVDNLVRKLGFKYPIYEIPFQVLSNFYLSEAQLSYYDPLAFGVESIFDILRLEGKTVFKDTFVEYNWSKWNDSVRAKKLIHTMSNFYDLFLLYLGQLDYAGHYFKQGSKELLVHLRQVDYIVFQTVKSAQKKYPHCKIIILGDHGMFPVQTYIDFYGIFKRLYDCGLAFAKDYVAFLDSTMARFWAKTSTALRILEDALHSIKYGRLLDLNLARKLHVPRPNHYIGETIWIANSGSVIYPDYFHTTKPVMGMHGYIPESDAHKGQAIILADHLSQDIQEEAELVDICPTLCRFLDIRVPNNCQGKSLI